MKKAHLMFVIILAFLSTSCHQKVKGQTPEAVKKSFQAKYPGENDPDWEVDAHGNYESHFKKDGVHYRADFRPDGSWIETESSMDVKDLPKAIRDVIDREYDDSEITEVEKVEHHSKGLFYDVEFKQKGKNHDVEFKANGDIIN